MVVLARDALFSCLFRRHVGWVVIMYLKVHDQIFRSSFGPGAGASLYCLLYLGNLMPNCVLFLYKMYSCFVYWRQWLSWCTVFGDSK